MDTRFSSAIHMLILISEAETPMTSEEIAASVGTNASYIRKVTGLLKKKGIIGSKRGVSGFQLTINPEQLPLYDVYQAVSETDQMHIFDLHQNPNDQCIVGRCGHICNASYAVTSKARGTHIGDQLGTIPGSFRIKDGHYDNICPYYKEL